MRNVLVINNSFFMLYKFTTSIVFVFLLVPLALKAEYSDLTDKFVFILGQYIEVQGEIGNIQKECPNVFENKKQINKESAIKKIIKDLNLPSEGKFHVILKKSKTNNMSKEMISNFENHDFGCGNALGIMTVMMKNIESQYNQVLEVILNCSSCLQQLRQ